jgi:hypothetical protein
LAENWNDFRFWGPEQCSYGPSASSWTPWPLFGSQGSLLGKKWTSARFGWKLAWWYIIRSWRTFKVQIDIKSISQSQLLDPHLVHHRSLMKKWAKKRAKEWAKGLRSIKTLCRTSKSKSMPIFGQIEQRWIFHQ